MAPTALPATKLRRSLGLAQATAMVVGIIVGASIFVQPTEVSRDVGSRAALYGVWLCAGALTWLGARVCAGLAGEFPQTGGVYVYLRETISPATAFTWGWAMFWTMHTGIIAAIAVVAARYCAVFLPLSEGGIRWVAVAAVGLVSAVNYFGVGLGGWVQTVLTAAKLGAIAVVLLLVAWLAPGRVPVAPPALPALLPSHMGFLLAVGAGLFAFGGWHMATYAAGETHCPERTIPRALMLGVAIVTVCYLGLNAAYARILPWDQMRASSHIAADAAGVLLGAGAARVVAALVIVSALGSLNGIVLAGPRVYFAMAHDGVGLGRLGAVHLRWRTPYAALALQAVWACVLVGTGSYRSLFTRVVYTEWLFFGLLAVGLMRHRGRLAAGPVIFLAGCGVVVATQVAANPLPSLMGLLFVAAGLPVYHGLRRFAREPDYADH